MPLRRKSPVTFAEIVTSVVIALTLCGVMEAVRWNDDHEDGVDKRDGGVKWIRLCTLTSEGSSVINMTMPCDVRVRAESTVKKRVQEDGDVPEDHRDEATDVVLSLGSKVKNHHSGSGQNATVEDGDNDGTSGGKLYSNVSDLEVMTTISVDRDRTKEMDSDGDDEYDDDGISVTEEQDYAVTEEEAQNHGVTAVGAQDGDSGNSVRIPSEGHSNAKVDVTVKVEAQGGAVDSGHSDVSGLEVTGNATDGAGVEEIDSDSYSVTVVHDEQDDRLKEHRRQSAVTKALLAYLLEARNRLHNKIRNLLNFLQQTFFNEKFNHRNRRNLMERQGKKKNLSITSVIMEPTFERSLMTMSFLMFGVFVIQVVQRLMHTLQPTGEITSFGNSVLGNLPTVSSNIFNNK